jgi:adenosylmethionine-8-amino-7-oxononanoate aminotransferase
VACEVLKIYEDENVVDGTLERAARIKSTIERLGQLDGVENARSLGMCGALDLGSSGDYLSNQGWLVYEQALRLGAYLRPLGHVVYLTPALNIPLDDLDELLSILEQSVGAVLSGEIR